MKTYFGNYLGIVINNNDPEFRGRVQVFVPHIMPSLYENWNKDGKDITITCVGDNAPQGISSEMLDKLRKILPWAEAASPIIGQSSPGNVSAGLANLISRDLPQNVSAGTPGGVVGNGQYLDQTPSSIPNGSIQGAEKLLIPLDNSGVDAANLSPGFKDRLNNFYNEAISLNYKITCRSAFRSYEKQLRLYNASDKKGSVAAPGGSAHEFGVAVDLIITGPGTSITSTSVMDSVTGKNYDTPAFRALLRKHLLHQPLHPQTTSASKPEHWHIEPLENPAAGGNRGPDVFKQTQTLLSKTVTTVVAETPNSSQLPPHDNPLTSKNPSGTSQGTPTSPTTTV